MLRLGYAGALAAGALLMLAGQWLHDRSAPTSATPRPTTVGDRLSTHQLSMAALQRERTIRVYLPPSYASHPERRYPVIYAHDAQNLYDDATSFVGEWNLDETLDALAASHGLEFIAVGIDHGDALRVQELIPWPHPELPAPEGEGYLAFVTDQLKPWVDAAFRTRPEARYTTIMGSSLGGLMAHYAAQQRPDIFGRALVFSPSYWVSAESQNLAQANGASQRMLFLVGEREGGSMVTDFNQMRERFAPLAEDSTLFHVVAHGEHNETLWRTHLAWALLWLQGEAGSPPQTTGW